MADIYGLGQRSRDVVQDTINRQRARKHDFIPQRRRRTAGRGRARGGTATSSIRTARVSQDIDPAIGAHIDFWGEGEVELQDEEDGTLTGTFVSVLNPLAETAFEVDCQVEIDMAYEPPRVRNGLCSPTDIWDYGVS